MHSRICLFVQVLISGTIFNVLVASNLSSQSLREEEEDISEESLKMELKEVKS